MNNRSLIITLCIFILCWLVATPATADWINLSGAQNAPNIAEIYINDDQVQVNLEIFVDDLVTFDRLIPDAFFKDTTIKRPPLTVRMKKFSNEDLQIITDEGEKLEATLTRAERRFRRERPSPYPWKINPYTGQPIPGPPEDKRVLYVELVYPFTKKPETVTIVPPLEGGISKAPIGFMTYHKEVPVVDFRYLSEPSTLKLDWEDPWYSAFEKKAMRRWQMGGVMSFLYIEPYEVRHEILARVKDLSAWIEFDLRGDEFIEADENEQLKKQVGEFFLKRDGVLIDGKRLRPILDRTSLVKYSTTASTFISQPERLPINTTMVGVIITYLTEGMPLEVVNTWDLWSDRTQKVPTDAIDPAGGFPSYVTPEDNVHVWKNFLKNYTIPTVDNVTVADRHKGLALPLGSLVCLLLLVLVIWDILRRKKTGRSIKAMMGLAVVLIAATVVMVPLFQMPVGSAQASRMTEDDARLILDSLLKNVYRAFDFRGEEDVYDKLAISVSGDLLSDIYLQHRKSMVVEQAGGAQARVKEIEIQGVQVEDSPKKKNALNFRAEWTALGTVGHWGHIHNRQNLYDAILTLAPVDGSWKIIDLELLEEKRIDPYAQPKK